MNMRFQDIECLIESFLKKTAAMMGMGLQASSRLCLCGGEYAPFQAGEAATAKATSVSVPLFVRRELYGLIICEKSGGFSRQEMFFASTLCTYAGMIIEKLSELCQIRKERVQYLRFAEIGSNAEHAFQSIHASLAGLRGLAESLPSRPEDGGASEYFSLIRSGIARMREVAEVFDPSSSQGFLKHQRVRIEELIDKSLEAVKERLSGITVVRSYGEDLPFVEDGGLRYVFLNIIKNAVEAMPGGGKLEISVLLQGRTAQVSFKDSGPGIPGASLEYIFEPFFSTKQGPAQRGLGLSLSKEIISTCGGSIDVRGCPGRGSEFIVLFPLEHGTAR